LHVLSLNASVFCYKKLRNIVAEFSHSKTKITLVFYPDEDISGDQLLAEARVGLVKIFPQLQKQFQVCLHRPSFQVHKRPAFQAHKRPALQVYQRPAHQVYKRQACKARGQPSGYTKGQSSRCKVHEAGLLGIQKVSLPGI
jgi:hypothetical protein